MRIITSAMFGAAALAMASCSPPPLKEYSYPAWGFAASFPSAPTFTEYPASADGAHPHRVSIEARQPGHDFVVSVADGSASTKSDDEVLSQVPDAVAAAAGGTVNLRTYVATGQVVGREAFIEKAGEPTLRLRVYVKNRRLYQIAGSSVLTPKDPEVVEFMDSFRLLDK